MSDLATMECPPENSLEASKEAPVKRGIPAALPIPWDEIFRLYVEQCVPAKDIAKKYGIRPGLIYQHAHRKKWATPANTVKVQASKAVQNAVKQRVARLATLAVPAVDKAVETAIREWQERSVTVAGMAMEQAKGLLEQPLDPDGLRTVVAAVDGADKVGRRGLGLDRGDTGSTDGTPVRVQLGIRLDLLGGADGLASLGPVLDVQAEQSG